MMDISMISGVVAAEYENAVSGMRVTETAEDGSFSSALSAAMGLVSETNQLQNDAESEKIKFALGQADNPHDMQIAESKALTALQYTVAVRDKLLDAYKEIMNMQI